MIHAYAVTVQTDKDGGLETLVVIQTDSKSKAHRIAQRQAKVQHGWTDVRITGSLRLPGSDPQRAQGEFMQATQGVLSPVEAEEASE